jgi:outer membrane immunogenic protein
MKRLILASSALALLAAPAFAADLPARTMAPAPAPFVSAPMFTWTGFYAGVNAGWVQNRTRVDNRGFANTGDDALLNTAFPARFGSATRDGFIGGVQAGYNQQFGMFVAGIEADINWLGDRRSTTSTTRTVNFPPAVDVNVGTRSRMDWLGTARLRAGVAFDRVMIYGTGGLAFGAPNHRTTVSVAGVGTTRSGTSDDMKAGWTLGGGAEFAFTNNITMKAEYLYYDLGRTTVTANPVAPSVGTLRTRYDNNGHIARVGLNYKF